MISKGTLDALQRRVEFTYQVGEQVGQVWDTFLKTQEGQTFEWKDEDGPDIFGQAKGSIRIKPSKKQTEKASVSITLKSSGQAFLSIAEWQLNDLGGWDEDSESLEIDLDPDRGADEATAQILTVMISSGSKFGKQFRRFIEASLPEDHSPKPAPDI